MVHCYAESVGLTRDQVYNAEKNKGNGKTVIPVLKYGFRN